MVGVAQLSINDWVPIVSSERHRIETYPKGKNLLTRSTMTKMKRGDSCTINITNAFAQKKKLSDSALTDGYIEDGG